jgi:outer membrane protease
MNKTSLLGILLIIIYLLSAINPIYSQDNDQNQYSFSIGTGFGVIYGQAMEYVYPFQGETKGEFLSELTWDMEPICYVGFNVDFGLIDLLSKPGFFSSLAIKAGIPGPSGNMEDRDWMSTVNGNLTHFSKHENETNELMWVDFSVGASLPFKYLYIKPFISGSWMHFSFTGWNGYYKYAEGISNGIYGPIEIAPEKPIHGKVISYQQDWFLLAAGCSIGTNILYPFLFDLSFQISPHTYCEATDNHIRTSTIYKDFTSFGLFLEPKGSISLDLKNIKFLLEASYRYISTTKGESYMGYNKSNIFDLSPNKAGAGFSAVDIQFLTKYTF